MTLPIFTETPAVATAGSSTGTADACGEVRSAVPVLDCQDTAAYANETSPSPRASGFTLPKGDGVLHSSTAPISVPVLEIHVFGQPAPQGSKSAFVNRHTGRASLVESSKKVKPWREAVKHAALDVIGLREGTGEPFCILGEPLFIYTVYSFVRPTTHYRTGRNAHLLRDNAPAYPCTRNKNDLEKLDRSTRDALTDAGAWTDDSLVAHHDSWKVFTREHCDALPVAGAVIRIYTMRPALLEQAS